MDATDKIGIAITVLFSMAVVSIVSIGSTVPTIGALGLGTETLSTDLDICSQQVGEKNIGLNEQEIRDICYINKAMKENNAELCSFVSENNRQRCLEQF